MAKVILYIGMSLDGYIADAAGGVGWMDGDGSDSGNPGSYPEFYESIGSIILGYTTYGQIMRELSPDRWAYSGKMSYVLTHRDMASTDEIIFTDEALENLLPELKKTKKEDIWICGGAEIANQCIDSDLIDTYCISVLPTILGEGIPLIHRRSKEKKLRLVSIKQYNGSGL